MSSRLAAAFEEVDAAGPVAQLQFSLAELRRPTRARLTLNDVVLPVRGKATWRHVHGNGSAFLNVGALPSSLLAQSLAMMPEGSSHSPSASSGLMGSGATSFHNEGPVFGDCHGDGGYFKGYKYEDHTWHLDVRPWSLRTMVRQAFDMVALAAGDQPPGTDPAHLMTLLALMLIWAPYDKMKPKALKSLKPKLKLGLKAPKIPGLGLGKLTPSQAAKTTTKVASKSYKLGFGGVGRGVKFVGKGIMKAGKMGGKLSGKLLAGLAGGVAMFGRGVKSGAKMLGKGFVKGLRMSGKMLWKGMKLAGYGMKTGAKYAAYGMKKGANLFVRGLKWKAKMLGKAAMLAGALAMKGVKSGIRGLKHGMKYAGKLIAKAPGAALRGMKYAGNMIAKAPGAVLKGINKGFGGIKKGFGAAVKGVNKGFKMTKIAANALVKGAKLAAMGLVNLYKLTDEIVRMTGRGILAVGNASMDTFGEKYGLALLGGAVLLAGAALYASRRQPARSGRPRFLGGISPQGRSRRRVNGNGAREAAAREAAQEAAQRKRESMGGSGRRRGEGGAGYETGAEALEPRHRRAGQGAPPPDYWEQYAREEQVSQPPSNRHGMKVPAASVLAAVFGSALAGSRGSNASIRGRPTEDQATALEASRPEQSSADQAPRGGVVWQQGQSPEEPQESSQMLNDPNGVRKDFRATSSLQLSSLRDLRVAHQASAFLGIEKDCLLTPPVAEQQSAELADRSTVFPLFFLDDNGQPRHFRDPKSLRPAYRRFTTGVEAVGSSFLCAPIAQQRLVRRRIES